MNPYEELKGQLQQSSDDQPISVPELTSKASGDLVTSIRNTMKREVIYQALFACCFFLIAFFPIWSRELHRSVYLIFIFVIVVMTLGYVVHLSTFLKRTAEFASDTREFLRDFVTDAKITIAAYESFVLAGSFLAPIPLFALFASRPSFGGEQSTFDKWFYVSKLSGGEVLLLVAVYLALIGLIIGVTKWWTTLLYRNRLSKLEDLLRELREPPAADIQ